MSICTVPICPEAICTVPNCPDAHLSWCRFVVLSWCPFVMVSNCPGAQLTWCPIVLVPICPGVHLFCAHLFWCPFVRCPFVQVPICPGAHSYKILCQAQLTLMLINFKLQVITSTHNSAGLLLVQQRCIGTFSNATIC